MSLARPTDWFPLAARDPAPGDLAETMRLARQAADTADEINQQAQRLRRLARADWWDADAGREFAHEAGELAGEMTKVHGRYATVGSRLGTYGRELEHAQNETAAALRAAKAADAQAQAHSVDLLTGVAAPTPEQRTAQRRQQETHADAAAALRAARRRMDDAVHDLDRVAKATGDAIRDAADDDVKDGFWDKVKGVVADIAPILRMIAKIASWVATAIAVVALVLAFTIGAPFALLLAGAIFTAVSLVANTALASADEGNWVDVGVDLFSLVTLGFGGRLAGLGAKAGAKAVTAAARVASVRAAERVMSQHRTMLAVARWASSTRVPLGPLRTVAGWRAARITAASTRAGDLAEALVRGRPLAAVSLRRALPTLNRELAQRLDLVRALTRELPSSQGVRAARQFALYSHGQGGVTAAGLGVDLADKGGAFDGLKRRLGP